MAKKTLLPVIELDGKAFSVFYDDMKNAFMWFATGYNSLNKWADRNGKGVLSPLGAHALKDFIKNTIDGESSWKPKWEPLSKEQAAFKEDRGSFGLPWKMEGNVYKNIVVRKSGSTWIVGVDKRVSVPKIGFRTNAQIRGVTTKVKVEVYAAIMEFGFESTEANIPERPLFIPAFARFQANIVPDLMDLVTKSMQNVAKYYRVSSYSSSKATGSTESVMSKASVDYSKGMEPNKDFSDGQFDEMMKSDLKISAKHGNISNDARKQASVVDKQDAKEVENFTKKHKINTSEMSPELLAELKKMGYA